MPFRRSQLTLQTILIVDDSIDLLEMNAVGLSRAGYRPLTAVVI
jgi:hypothetical protein